MADLDLEALEELMKQEEKVAKQGGLPSSQQGASKLAENNVEDDGHASRREDHRSRESKDRSDSRRRHRSSRSRSERKKRSHKSHKHSSSHRHKKHRHSSSRSVSDSRSRREKKEEEPVEDPVKKQEEALKKQIEEAKRQAEEAQRDDCTILVNRLPLQANEKDIYMFFSKDKGVGKIRDVRLIRDQRTNKSKGIAYMEFYTPESVLLAMALSGTQLMGQTINIQASQAEKNRAAAASKYKKEQDKNEHGYVQGVGTLSSLARPPGQDERQKKEYNNKVYVGGLVDVLNQVSESDIRQWFSPFGDIDSIELPKDSVTGRNKGHAIIEYNRHRDAKNAVREMNGFDVLGRQLKCSIVTDQMTRSLITGAASRDMDLEEDTGSQYIHSAQSRILLMQKLSRDPNANVALDSGQQIKSQNYANHPSMIPAMMTQSQPTNCLLLNNMFDPAQVDLKKEPAFFIDIKEQVEDICREMGKVEKVWVEQNSPGNVWVKFNKADIVAAQNAVATLNQRYFDSRLITANYVPENVFNSKVKER